MIVQPRFFKDKCNAKKLNGIELRTAKIVKEDRDVELEMHLG